MVYFLESLVRLLQCHKRETKLWARRCTHAFILQLSFLMSHLQTLPQMTRYLEFALRVLAL